MKKLFFSVLLLSLLLITACERFEQDYIKVIHIEDFVNSFQNDAQNALKNNDINTVMAFYSPDYLNDGMNKTAMQGFYDRTWSDSVKVQIIEINPDSMSYQIRIIDNGRAVDTTWVDYAKRTSTGYYWYGNQVNIIELPKQKALVEVLTGLWCPNCPNAEHELNEIYQTIPNQMVMINYHIGPDSLGLNLSDCAYYGNTAPSVLFQGKTKVSGANQAQLDQYLPLITNIITADAEMTLTNLQFQKNGNTVTGSVKINNLNNVNLTNTYLRAVIYEKETTAIHLISHEAAENVVRARAMVDLSGSDLSQPISFSVNSDKYLDSDTWLVIWVQKNESFTTINPETDKVYNCIEVPLNTRGVK